LQKLSKDLARKRALLIDRYPNARSSLRLMLAALGITAVHNASTSAEVLRQVRTHRFDIVLSDYLLEDGRDGHQLLEELRQQHLLPQSAVFMLITGERTYHNVVSIAELAPDDYLIKPFTADELHARLARALYKKAFFCRGLRAPGERRLRQRTGRLRTTRQPGERVLFRCAAHQGRDPE